MGLNLKPARGRVRRVRNRSLRRSWFAILFLWVLQVPADASGPVTRGRTVGTVGGTIDFRGARISIPENALREPLDIRIERLTDKDLPALEPGMTNVTKGGGGYRFLPHGTTFAKEVTIQLPIEPPPTVIHGDIGARTYFWDEMHHYWVPLKRLRLEPADNTLVSTTTHFTVMINAILTAPDHPSPLQFNPNSIKDVAAADPAARIDLIEPPNPNSQGTAELTYPIRLPRGRGTYSPQLALAYSSSRGNGWLGVGWDLETPRIEIDTRWGVPAYESGDLERERFLLNGAPLVPIAKDPRASCAAGSNIQLDKQFAPRVDTFQRIVRCRSGNDVHWEVTAKDGTRFEYGTDDESRLTSYQPAESTHVAVWFLRRVVDPNDNLTEFHYFTDSAGATPNFQGEPFVQKYLKQIVYTSHPTREPKYRVDLTSDCSMRQDVIVGGRTGFKVLTRCRLSQIEVQLESRLIRRYVFDYQVGAFGKSLLSRVRVKGSDGSDFYEHSFDYTRPEFQEMGNKAFAEKVRWSADQIASEVPPINATDALLTNTVEKDHLIEFRAGIGFSVGMGQTSAGCDIGVSAGLNFGYPSPEIEHSDLNGDYIADRVWLTDSRVEALIGRPAGSSGAYSGPSEGTAFGTDLSRLGSQQEIGGLYGIDGGCRGFGGGVSGGLSFSGRESGTSSLLTDADGDGRIDLAVGKSILSGLPHQCSDGTTPFGAQCSDGLSVCSEPTKFCFRPLEFQGSLLADHLLFARNSLPLEIKDIASIGNQRRETVDDTTRLLPASSSTAPRTEPLDPPVINRNTELRNRLDRDPMLHKELYRLDPVIRWDAWHTGSIKLSASARRKRLGGLDGVTITLLRLNNPLSENGTQQLGQLHLPPDSEGWQDLPGAGNFDVRFEDTFLVVVDTVDDVPVDEKGTLLDEIELRFHVEYVQICAPNQPCRPLRDSERNHRDATGQLAYVFDFPGDLLVSELPRNRYWRLLPPISQSARVRVISPPGTGRIAQVIVEHNRISGKVRKLKTTDTPVHVRIRCESVESQRANDETACPMGTVLAEKLLGPDEITPQQGIPFTVERLPYPFRKIAGTLHPRYEPYRLLFEVDGENGMEIPPDAVSWNPAIEIVSVNDIEKVELIPMLPKALYWLGQVSFINPNEPWTEHPQVLYRVHPSRELTPFRSSQDDQEVQVTARVKNLHRQLQITITGDDIEGQVGKLILPENTGTGVVRNNQVLEATQDGGDTLAVSYRQHTVIAAFARIADPSSAGGDDAVEFKDDLGQTRISFNAGEHLGLQINDHEANRNNNVRESIAVDITTVKSGDLEKLVLLETGPDTGIFSSCNDPSGAACVESGLLIRSAIPFAVTRSFTARLPRAGLYYVRGYTEAGFDITTSVTVSATLSGLTVPVNLLTAKFAGTKFFAGLREPLPALAGEVPYTFEPYGGGHHGFFYGEFNGEDKLICIGPRPCISPHPRPDVSAVNAPHISLPVQSCSDQDLDCDGLNDGKDACPFAFGDPSHRGCPDPNEPPREPPPCAGQPQDLGPDGCLGQIVRRFQPMDGNIVHGRSCFTGSDPIARACSDGTHPTRNNSIPRSSDGLVDGEESDQADLRRSWTFGVSVYGGASIGALGLNINAGTGMTWTDLEFMDWNGDGVPDSVTPHSVSLTGLNREFNVDSAGPVFDAVRDSLNVTSGIGTSLGSGSGAIELRTSPGGRLKAQTTSSLVFHQHAEFGKSTTITDRLDVNGDGLPDLVYGEIVSTDSDEVKMMVRLNLGNRLGVAEDWGNIDIGRSQVPNLGTLSHHVRTDIEGRPDNSKPRQRALYTNDNLSTGVGVGGDFGLDFGVIGADVSGGKSDDATLTQTQILFGDVNGDGLPDRIFKSPSEPCQDGSTGMCQVVRVRFNRGGVMGPPTPGAFEPEDTFDITYVNGSWNPAPSFPNAMTPLDWAGAALNESPDVMQASESVSSTYGGKVEVKVFFGLFGDYSFSYRYTGGRGGVELGFYDVDGDGLPDRVLRTGSEQGAAVQVQKNRFGKANLLRSVKRPLGGQLTLHYDKQTSPSEDDPHPRWLLTSYNLEHQSTFPLAFRTTQLTESFEYEGPFYNRIEREFLGFRRVTATRGDGRVLEIEYFNRDYRLRGVVHKTRLLGPGPTVYTEVVNENADGSFGFQFLRSHAAQESCTNSLGLPLAELRNSSLGTPCESWFVKPTSTITRWFEGGTTPKQSAIRYVQYDEFGNLTKLVDEQDEGNRDDLTATIEYDRQDPLLAAHIIDRVTRIAITGSDGVVFRLRQAIYDARGNLKRHEIFADTAGTKIAVLNLSYDATGFIRVVTDTNNYQIQYTPDDTVGIFSAITRDSFGLESRARYDFGFQLATDLIDANGQHETTTYDSFGRLKTVTGPYERAAGINSLEVAYSIPFSSRLPAGAVTRNRGLIPGADSASATDLHSTRFVDALGRLIETRADAEVNGIPGQLISGSVQFDQGGRLVAQGQPSFSPGVIPLPDPFFPFFVPMTRPTTFEYDSMDRKKKIVEPTNRVTNTTYGLSVHPRIPGMSTLVSRVVDPDGKEREEHRDASGRLVAVVQKLDGRSLVTSYHYQPTGELLSIRDALDRVTSLDYDLAGRRLAVTTPDTGRLELVYDANGNLIQKIDPVLRSRREMIEYHYDANRLKSIVYPETPSVRFSYGGEELACPGQTNINGRICKIADASGVELRSYGSLGELINSVRTMKGAAWENTDRQFVTRFVYDSFGRMRTLIYPDGEALTYKYDRGGRVNKVTGRKLGLPDFDYVTNIQYDEFGQRTLIQYGNGVETDEHYEQDTRRLREVSIRKADGTPFYNLQYQYDPAGNILQTVDTRGLPPLFLTDVVKTYTYDDLHRLKSSSMQAQDSGGASWSIATVQNYDDVGNIEFLGVTRRRGAISQTDYPSRTWSYRYGNTDHPNAPETVGPYSFTYDARGSVLHYERSGTIVPPGATFTWDEEAQLITSRAQDSLKTTEYAYNFEGKRVRKQTPDTLTTPGDPSDTTIYPNEYYVARFARRSLPGCSSTLCWDTDVSRTKQVYVDGQRTAVVTLVVPPSEETKSEDNIQFVTMARQFFHSDPVGSTHLLTSQAGDRTQELDYLPFGEVLFDKRPATTQPIAEDYRFDGKELDTETGLHYFGARYYDAAFGRWISADPLFRLAPEIDLTAPLKLNLYAFSLNNPVRYSDPNGRGPFDMDDVMFGLIAQNEGLWPAIKYLFRAKAADIQKAAGNTIDFIGTETGMMLSTPFCGCTEPVRKEAYRKFEERVEEREQRALQSKRGSLPEEPGAKFEAGELRSTTQGVPKSLSQFTQSTVDDVVASAARARSSHITEGARAIAKKLGHAASGGFKSAFQGIAPTQANAEALIKDIISNPTRTFYGNKVIDVYNAAGQGVRFEAGTRRFIGFLEGVLETR